jgi:type II secretory pathway pseudopilin PulG
MPLTSRKRKGRRAYLLLEVAVGAGIVAAALLFALGLAARSRATVSGAGQRASAAALARAQAESVVSSLPAGVGDQALAAVPGMPGLRMGWSTANGTLPGVTSAVRDVTVTVEYSVPVRSREDVETPPVNDGKAQLTVVRTWAQR